MFSVQIRKLLWLAVSFRMPVRKTDVAASASYQHWPRSYSARTDLCGLGLGETCATEHRVCIFNTLYFLAFKVHILGQLAFKLLNHSLKPP